MKYYSREVTKREPINRFGKLGFVLYKEMVKTNDIGKFNKNKRIKRDDLLKIVNETLKKSNQKEISLSSLKRYIGVSKLMTSDDRERLYTSYYENFKERKDEMSSATNNMKNIKKKKFDYISINIIDDIMKNI